VQAHFRDITGVHADRNRFEVQKNIDDVFLDAFDRRVLVQHAFDLDLRDRRSGREDSSTRRKALPSVWPKPRSNGSITIRAWRGDMGCTLTTRGFRNSLIDPCMDITYVN